MSWCLTKQKVDEFKKALRDDEINPERMMGMSSKERFEFFKEKFGETDAKELNRRLESKLILKDQIAGMIRWAESVIAPKQIKRDLVTRIEKLDKVLDPETEQEFLNDLANHRLGTSVSYEEAKKIMELSNKVSKEAHKKGTDDRMDYGYAVTDLTDYVSELKQQAKKTTWTDVKARPLAAVAKAVSAVPGITKGIKASFDNSAVFRQGWKTLLTHPIQWQKQARQSFVNLLDPRVTPEDVMRTMHADIASRENYDLMKKAKLDVGQPEEDFPTALPEKVPIAGRAYKRAEVAYTAFTQRLRADLFDAYIGLAKDTGVELMDSELRNIGRMVNSLTGRSDLGKLERAGSAINSVFFSPRFLKSHIDVLTQPITGGSTKDAVNGEGSNFVRKEAGKNLIKILAAQAVIFGLARALLGEDRFSLDPRSSDFAKIKVGNTRWDTTGGMGSLAVLAGRLLTGSIASSTTGEVSSLTDPKYGGQNRYDVAVDFIGNKMSPIGGVVRDYLKGKDFGGNPITARKVAKSLLLPLPIENGIEVWKDPVADNPTKVAAILADALGIATNTYGSSRATQKLINEAEKRGDENEVKRLQEIRGKQLSEEAKKKGKDTSRVSDQALQEQFKQADVSKALDIFEELEANNADTSAITKVLEEKIARKVKSNKLTADEADRANRLLGTNYKAQVDDEPELEGKYTKNADGLIEKVFAWGKAFGSDPVDAWNKLIGGEYIARVVNGTIIVKRMPLAASASERAKLGGGGKQVKLDHIIPLQLGGSNDKSNLQLVTTDEWARYTPMENYIGQALDDGKIDKTTAQDLIRRFKLGWIGENDIVSAVGNPYTGNIPTTSTTTPKKKETKLKGVNLSLGGFKKKKK